MTEPITQESTIGDQRNMAFSGTHVESGTASGIVVETGDDTQIGQINQAIQSVKAQETPLIKKKQLNHQIFKGIIGLVIFLIFFTTYGFDLDLLFSSGIALVVAMIPEGLPAVLTMILSMVSRKCPRSKQSSKRCHQWRH